MYIFFVEVASSAQLQPAGSGASADVTSPITKGRTMKEPDTATKQRRGSFSRGGGRSRGQDQSYPAWQIDGLLSKLHADNPSLLLRDQC